MLQFPVCHWAGGRFANNGDGGTPPNTAFPRRPGGLTGIADGKTGTLAFWARLNQDGQVFHIAKPGGGNRVRIVLNGPADGQFRTWDSLGQPALIGNISGYADVDVPSNRKWRWYGFSWNSGASRMAAFENDVDRQFAAGQYDTTIDTELAGMDCAVWGTRISASATCRGCFAYLFFSTAEYDFNGTSNRRLFIDADGKPVTTFPSGGIVQSELGTVEPNEGSGGAFTIIDPPWITCADNP